MKSWKIVKVSYNDNVKIIKKEPKCICNFLDNDPKYNETVYLTYRRYFRFFWKRIGQLSEEGYNNLCERVNNDPSGFKMEDLFILK